MTNSETLDASLSHIPDTDIWDEGVAMILRHSAEILRDGEDGVENAFEAISAASEHNDIRVERAAENRALEFLAKELGEVRIDKCGAEEAAAAMIRAADKLRPRKKRGA